MCRRQRAAAARHPSRRRRRRLCTVSFSAAASDQLTQSRARSQAGQSRAHRPTDHMVAGLDTYFYHTYVHPICGANVCVPFGGGGGDNQISCTNCTGDVLPTNPLPVPNIRGTRPEPAGALAEMCRRRRRRRRSPPVAAGRRRRRATNLRKCQYDKWPRLLRFTIGVRECVCAVLCCSCVCTGL